MADRGLSGSGLDNLLAGRQGLKVLYLLNYVIKKILNEVQKKHHYKKSKGNICADVGERYTHQ